MFDVLRLLDASERDAAGLLRHSSLFWSKTTVGDRACCYHRWPLKLPPPFTDSFFAPASDAPYPWYGHPWHLTVFPLGPYRYRLSIWGFKTAVLAPLCDKLRIGFFDAGHWCCCSRSPPPAEPKFLKCACGFFPVRWTDVTAPLLRLFDVAIFAAQDKNKRQSVRVSRWFDRLRCCHPLAACQALITKLSVFYLFRRFGYRWQSASEDRASKTGTTPPSSSMHGSASPVPPSWPHYHCLREFTR